VPFLALSVELDGRDPEVAEEACFDAGALSVTLTDAVDDAILEPAPGELRLWPRTVLQALFDGDAAEAGTVGVLAAALGVPGSAIRAQRVEDRVWEREWLRDFHAMRFGRRLWIVPHHEALPADPAAVVVRLDPGLAFGTGTHPSTALCLAWLDEHLAQGETVIDYGSGSGVLAIAAARLGAGAVHSHDIDPQAGIALADNAAANDVATRITWHADPATLPAAADVVVANIISGILCELAPRLAGSVRAGGRLVLAGILDGQVDEVIAAYRPWLALAPCGRRDGWTALSGVAGTAGAT
jgi:ribosomal protein L11 methyltransferase